MNYLFTFKYLWCSASLSAKRDCISDVFDNKLINSGSLLLELGFLFLKKLRKKKIDD